MNDPAVELVGQLHAPAAVCDATGQIRACNDAFVDWAGPVDDARVEIHGSRGVLYRVDGGVRPLVLVGLAGGTWLALGSVGEADAAVAVVASAVAGRLERVELALASNAQIGLSEQPAEPVARCFREALAIASEVGRLRRQVAALGADLETERQPWCLWGMVRDAIGALRPAPLRLEPSEGDPTVELDRARFFPVLVALLDELAASAVPADPVVASLHGGDQVRLRLRGAAIPFADTAAIAAARRFVAPLGGRVLLTPGAEVVLELPAFARELRAGGGFGTVLTVDDDDSTLAMMGAVLRRAGFRVLAAGDGVAASSLLRQHRNELVAIVADAVLPGRSGIELAAEARRTRPGLPVLLVSGHSSDLLGAVDLVDLPILSKPFGARALAEKVRALVTEPH